MKKGTERERGRSRARDEGRQKEKEYRIFRFLLVNAYFHWALGANKQAKIAAVTK